MQAILVSTVNPAVGRIKRSAGWLYIEVPGILSCYLLIKMFVLLNADGYDFTREFVSLFNAVCSINIVRSA